MATLEELKETAKEMIERGGGDSFTLTSNDQDGEKKESHTVVVRNGEIVEAR